MYIGVEILAGDNSFAKLNGGVGLILVPGIHLVLECDDLAVLAPEINIRIHEVVLQRVLSRLIDATLW